MQGERKNDSKFPRRQSFPYEENKLKWYFSSYSFDEPDEDSTGKIVHKASPILLRLWDAVEG